MKQMWLLRKEKRNNIQSVKELLLKSIETNDKQMQWQKHSEMR